MEKSQEQRPNPIDWKRLLNYEIKSSWTAKKQAEFLEQVSELLLEGFTLAQALDFLETLDRKFQNIYRDMQADLSQGAYFYQVLDAINLSDKIIFQIKLVENYDDLASGLGEIADYIRRSAQNQQKIKQTLAYPLALVVLMIGLMLVLRVFLLPQLQAMLADQDLDQVTYALIHFLENLPQTLVILLALVSLLAILSYVYHRLTTPLRRAQTYVVLPFLGKYFRLYYTYYFAHEFSQLFAIGYSSQQIMTVFAEQDQVAFLSEFGTYLESNYKAGIPFVESLAKLGIFTIIFPEIVAHGELVSQLAIKMRFYSRKCLDCYYQELTRLTNQLKNIMFLAVSMVVVLVYLVLMLPMLNMLGQI
ncbi:hypothetical protein AWM75_02170 [Aerococcus urinaehominis]|uniref:Uncharacterized protein n=1 Tax=Aerococcus urinaehominis TaxID=128944 RepID=A0A0X8FKQ7_9LACT|nr:competence type IV pilus assembly protein ComGB [Aerococcus urinaehominis]AMB98869.1 hypothetical protein AWM75_02170 [Aerococcus urinaehominis]SDM16596.1 competence protein ComGB [Aerococcus urinaehominis]